MTSYIREYVRLNQGGGEHIRRRPGFVLAGRWLAFAALIATTAAVAMAQGTGSARVRPGRLLGVYDDVSGAPLDDVTVTNAMNGLSAKTTATGTLTLFFVDTTGGLLRLQKLGYQPLLIPVTNSVRDTIPVTLMMVPVSVQLSAVHTIARAHRGPADTVRKLELSGFYDRRVQTAAPSSAFQTAEKLERLAMLSDVYSLSGRQICLTNLYINGVRVMGSGVVTYGPGRKPNRYAKTWIDELVDVHEVLGVEMYRSGEAPVEYNATRPPNAPDCGVTLIWTR